ncbi:hypothetical protein B0H19DRAFT_108122 [Mycena capillaripes]|nr:hypothetical protein B0H19DRAFT_108122 [Mycena capillaripes]
MADYAYAQQYRYSQQPHPHQQYRAVEWDVNAHAPRQYSPSNPSTHPSSTSLNNTHGGNTTLPPPTTLLWSDLEPWMDAEYARQVCALMRWEAGVRVPPPEGSYNTNGYANNASGGNGMQPNNAGYCVLTFASAAAAAGALAQVTTSGTPMTMPNSARAFVLGWAPAAFASAAAPTSPSAASTSTSTGANATGNGNSTSTSNGSIAGNNANPSTGTANSSTSTSNGNNGADRGANAYPTVSGVVSPTSPLSPVGVSGNGFPHSQGVVGGVPIMPMNGLGGMNGGVGAGMGVGVGGVGPYPKEYSIFVGDLAPETSNSDLVAVFRNPVLGLRNDRAPKFIRPFASCKSAKIMLDPVTGVSRGYGFVRFTDEQDQQRALIEMHGLYCLSRPMRISPATAKFKPPPGELPASASGSASLPTSVSAPEQGQGHQQHQQEQQQQQAQQQSVSAPIAVPYYPGQGQVVATSASGGQEYFAGYHGQQQQQQQQSQSQSQALVAQPHLATQQQQLVPAQQLVTQAGAVTPQGEPTPAEWQHHAQARAILGTLMGPHGEQLTSTDPYNTTVFVGGLSPLVGEETLRTFFVPFGEIHYVKVPVGKHCGFVQFVRKADAERAIEKMQGFPVGGSRIRLSWGRSQYKAAQAAAQAAQAAALAAQAAPQQQQQQQQLQAQPQQQIQPQVQVGAAPVPQVQAQAANPNANPTANVNGNGGMITPAMLEGMTHEQAIALLQKFGMQGYAPSPPNAYASVANGYAAPVPAPNANVNASASANGGSYGPGPGPASSASSSNNIASSGSNGAEALRNGFHSSSPSNSKSSIAETYTNASASASAGGAPQPQFTDESLKVRRDEGPFGYPQRASYEVPPPAPTGGSSSFSPFSPDPNQPLHQGQAQQQHHQQHQPHHQQQQGMSGLYAAAELLGKRRDSYAGAYGHPGGLPHPSKSYAPGFFPVPPALQTPVGHGHGANGGGKISGSGSPTRGGYGAGSPPAFQVNRYQSHAQTQPISRPNSGSARSVGAGVGERGVGGDEFDAMHDLNGTLASLDLDREREREFGLGLGERAWSLKSPTLTDALSEESTSTSSGGSVQFRMTMGRTPSP